MACKIHCAHSAAAYLPEQPIGSQSGIERRRFAQHRGDFRLDGCAHRGVAGSVRTQKRLDLHACFGVAATHPIQESGALYWMQVGGPQEDLLNPVPLFVWQGVFLSLKCPSNWYRRKRAPDFAAGVKFFSRARQSGPTLSATMPARHAGAVEPGQG